MEDEQVIGSVTLDADGTGTAEAAAIADQIQPGDLARVRVEMPVPIDWVPNITGLIWSLAQTQVAVTNVWLEGSNVFVIEWQA